MPTFKVLWKAKTHDEKQEMAIRLETDINYLSQIAHGHRRPGTHFANAIESDTGVPRHILFDHYHRIPGS